MFLFTSLENKAGPPPPPSPPAVDNTLDFLLNTYKITGTEYTLDQVIANTGRRDATGLRLVWPEDWSPAYVEPVIDPVKSAIISAFIGVDFGMIIDVTDVNDNSGSQANVLAFSNSSSGTDQISVIVDYDDDGHSPTGLQSAILDQSHTGGSRYAAAGTFSSLFPGTHRIAVRRSSSTFSGGITGLGCSNDGGMAGDNAPGEGAAAGISIDQFILGGYQPTDEIYRSLVIRKIRFFVPAVDDAALAGMSAL